ncbi:MAG: GNAT family N-acetyltransferase [Desulfobacteraceae bacterium]|nr:GNAT family N-acetyltransferase [Desulfobacteraceae bacterium]MBC2749216.1 GNAT family N-acetyltransferase [Desulfobacteraceae bacterium]
MKITVLNTTEKLYHYRKSWKRLVLQCPRATVFQTWEWAYRWWETFSSGKKLFVLVFDNDKGDTVGIAPLYKRKRRFGIRIMCSIEFLGSGEMKNSEYLDLLISTGNEEKTIKCFFSYLKQQNKEWDCIYLTNCRENSLVSENFIHLLKSAKLPWIQENNMPCPFIKLPSTMDELLKRFKAKARYNIRNECNKLFDKHNVNIYRCFKKNDIDKTVDLLFELHRIRFGDNSVFYSNKNREFFKTVSNDFLDENILRLYIMEIDGEPAAAIYGLLYGSSFIDYQNGFNTKWTKMNAAKVLMCKTIESVINESVEVFDFGRGTEQYKLHWSKELENTYDFLIFKCKFQKSLFNNQKKIYKRLKSLLTALK